MQTILVTGANGFLGSRIAKYYTERYNVIALDHKSLDITEAELVMQRIEKDHPDIVIHCAAISKPSYAEKHPDLAQKVNVEGTLNLAKACQLTDAKFIFMSSDQVYNGTRQSGLLSEDAPLSPVDVYGRNKLETEQKVFSFLPSAVALRLTWMYDAPDSENVNLNIYTLLLQTYAEKSTIKVSTNEFRGFTDVWWVVKHIEKCFSIPGGAYNFGSENQRNCYQSFVDVAKELQLPNPEKWILPDTTAPFRNISMNTAKIRRVFDKNENFCQNNLKNN